MEYYYMLGKWRLLNVKLQFDLYSTGNKNGRKEWAGTTHSYMFTDFESMKVSAQLHFSQSLIL